MRLPIFASCLLLLLPGLTGCSQPDDSGEQPVRPIRAMTVGDATDLIERSFPGRASAAQEADLSFRVTGPLITFPVKVGDEVATGQLLASLDPRDFEVRLRNAQGNLQSAEANLIRAKSDYNRVFETRRKNPGAVSKLQIDRVTENLASAEADLKASQATVDAAEDELSYTKLSAPFAGTVVATYVENFEFVQARQRIVRLLDKERIEFVVNIPEGLISMAQYVTNIMIEYDAFPGVQVPAEIAEIGTEASETTRTFPVTLAMEQPEGVRILPGMAGRASGISVDQTGTEQAQMVVPLTAVFSPLDKTDSYVWVIDPGTQQVSKREIQLGAITATGQVVESGLEKGEMIAIAGVHFLAEGQRVNPVAE